MSNVRYRSGGFFMVRNDLFPSILKDVGPTGFTVYCCLLRRSSNGTCFPSREAIATDCGISEDSVKRLLRDLRDGGYITVHARFDTDGRQTSNLYIIEDLVTPVTPPECTGNPHEGGMDTPHQGVTDAPQTRLSKEQDPEEQDTLSLQTLPFAFGESSTPATESVAAGAKSRTAAAEVWQAYADAYVQRYKVEPVRNAKTNGQIAQYLKRVPAELAVPVATFYLSVPNAYYLQKQHSVGQLLQDCEALCTQYRTGQRVTAREAHEQDRISAQAAMIARVDAHWNALRAARLGLSGAAGG